MGVRTDRFRRQHAALTEQGRELVARASSPTLADDADEVARLLARFAGTLSMHATMEEQALYPRLLESDNPSLQRLAQGLLDDVGPIYAQVTEFVRAWARPSAIREDPQGFATDLREVVRVLATRLAREDRELYATIDAEDPT